MLSELEKDLQNIRSVFYNQDSEASYFAKSNIASQEKGTYSYRKEMKGQGSRDSIRKTLFNEDNQDVKLRGDGLSSARKRRYI